MNPNENPLIKFAEVAINDVTYKLVYDFKSIALAERKIPNINLLAVFQRLDTLSANEFLALLWASLLKFQPSLTMDSVADLISIDSQPKLMNALAQAYVASLPEKKEEAEANDEQSPL